MNIINITHNISAHLSNLDACVLIMSECCSWSKRLWPVYLGLPRLRQGSNTGMDLKHQHRKKSTMTAIDGIMHCKISHVVSFGFRRLAALSAANWGSEVTLICRSGWEISHCVIHVRSAEDHVPALDGWTDLWSYPESLIALRLIWGHLVPLWETYRREDLEQTKAPHFLVVDCQWGRLTSWGVSPSVKWVDFFQHPSTLMWAERIDVRYFTHKGCSINGS